QPVLLTRGRRQLAVGAQVGAAQHEFRGAVPAVGADENYGIVYLLPVAALHVLQKFAEQLLALARFALTGFVQYVVGQEREHAFVVGGIEMLVILFKYGLHGSSENYASGVRRLALSSPGVRR